MGKQKGGNNTQISGTRGFSILESLADNAQQQPLYIDPNISMPRLSQSPNNSRGHAQPRERGWIRRNIKGIALVAAGAIAVGAYMNQETLTDMVAGKFTACDLEADVCRGGDDPIGAFDSIAQFQKLTDPKKKVSGLVTFSIRRAAYQPKHKLVGFEIAGHPNPDKVHEVFGSEFDAASLTPVKYISLLASQSVLNPKLKPEEKKAYKQVCIMELKQLVNKAMTQGAALNIAGTTDGLVTPSSLKEVENTYTLPDFGTAKDNKDIINAYLYKDDDPDKVITCNPPAEAG